jgi:oligoendopeptidase F
MDNASTTHDIGVEGITWDLGDLYAGLDDPAIERDMNDADARADVLADQYRGNVANLDAAGLLQLVKGYENILETSNRTSAFAYLLWSTNTEDQAAGALLQRATERGSRLSQKLVFVGLEWANVEDEQARGLIEDATLGHYHHWLETTRQYKPHLLSEPEEKILAEKSITGREALVRFFEETLGAAKFELDGQQVPEQVVLSKLYDVDRAVRQRAAASLTAGLRSMLRTTTYVFNTILADKASDDTLRSYASWISSRNLGNEVDDGTVQALVDSLTARYDIVARYYRLKRELLGLDELFDYDRYAPLPTTERIYRWEEAKEIVLGAYAAFDPRMAEIAQMFFDKRWIDAEIKPGKRSGAYSHPAVPSVHPYVFLNYEGTPKEVMTLAHELGHGVHQWLAREQGLLQADTPLTTAETASVFGEMLVFQELLKRESDPRFQLALLTSKIEDTFATVFRQIAMNRFEDAIHTSRRTEGELPTTRLTEHWLATQRAMFGDSVSMTEDYGIWWSYIPHFIHTPGYVYAYSFGNLLVLALYARYQATGADFPAQYLSMLASGGSDWPNVLMQPLGVDLTDPDFWKNGLSLVEEMVKQAEDLALQIDQ